MEFITLYFESGFLHSIHDNTTKSWLNQSMKLNENINLHEHCNPIFYILIYSLRTIIEFVYKEWLFWAKWAGRFRMIAFYVFLTSLNKLCEENHKDLTQSLSNCSPIHAKIRCKIEQIVLHITCVYVQSSNIFFSQSRLIYLNLYNILMLWKIITPLFISAFNFLVFSTLNLLIL